MLPQALVPSVRSALTHAAAALAGIGEYPGRDAAILLRRAMGKSQAWLLAHSEEKLTEEQAGQYQQLLARRLQHEPIQYILGEQEFYGLPLRVTSAVLIPRPETEHLVEAVLARFPRERVARIVDVGTGSGAVALALAKHLPSAQVDALDLSSEALAAAKGNAVSLGLTDRVRFFESDLLASAPEEWYDCIASNPPYVAEGDQLAPQVSLWEPHAALFAGPDGLKVYRRLLPQAAARLREGGLLALEVGAGQAHDVAALMALEACFSAAEIAVDLQGVPRILCAFRIQSKRVG